MLDNEIFFALMPHQLSVSHSYSLSLSLTSLSRNANALSHGLAGLEGTVLHASKSITAFSSLTALSVAPRVTANPKHFTPPLHTPLSLGASHAIQRPRSSVTTSHGPFSTTAANCCP